jgi:dipeptidyl aminopeptidase/acylaminoacyl peptidase
MIKPGRITSYSRALAPASLLAALLAVLPAMLVAQQPNDGRGNANGKSVTPASYFEWRSMGGSSISNDGKWVVYSLSPFLGSGELLVRSTKTTTEYRVPRGYNNRPRNKSGGVPAATAGGTYITPDSRFVVFGIDAPRDSVEAAYKAKKKPADQPKASMAIMDLSNNGQLTRIARVRSFRVPTKGNGAWVAYTPEPDTAKPKSDTTKKDPAKPDSAKKDSKKDTGSVVILRELRSGAELKINNVVSHTFTDDGSTFAYIVSTKDGAADGIFILPLEKLAAEKMATKATAVITGSGRYRSLVFDKPVKQVAFLTDKDEYTRNADSSKFALYYAKLDGTPARALVMPSVVGTGMQIPSGASISFTKDGKGVFFGIGPKPIELLPADSLTEKAVFDLWHWNDPYIQPSQKQGAGALREPWYQTIYWLDEGRWLKLGNDSAMDVRLSDNGKIGLATSVFPYRVRGMWGDLRTDVFLVDPRNGSWKLIKRAMEPTGGPVPQPGRGGGGGGAQLSPGGKYVLMFERYHWYSYDVALGRLVNLTEKIDAKFYDEEDDHPALPPADGIAGWTTDDDRVLIYDGNDIWEIDPTGAAPARNMTDGMGKAEKISFRLLPNFDRQDDDPYIDPKKPVMLSATNNETMASGIFRERIGGGGPPEKLLWGDKRYSINGKAKNSGEYVVTQQTFREFPDLWVGTSFDKLTRISDANPQQKDYRWGSAQIVHYTSTKGVPLKGVLFKPDGFDPSKKYPLMVHLYEIMSNNLHQYVVPRPSSGSVNLATYVSNGYLVLTPDIVYENGHPGQSALAAVVPAVQSLIDSGFVDPKRIGIEGYSWGAYEIAYMVTQTNIFAAASPGSLVANMISAYGGIRWGGGINRSMQYERTQSRIGATPWDRPDLYIENSPVFHVKNITTPILMQDNDEDGAVPWYQGIEYYIALRRLGKEIYFFSYNGEGHGLSYTANILDWDRRQWQFFDHLLRGGPRPEWMDKGIPFINKGRDQAWTDKW